MTNRAMNKTNEKRLLSASFVFACLVVMLVASALAVVSVSHEGRSQVGLLKRLEQANTGHLAQASRLQLEFSTLAEFSRVESRAAERLGMQRISSAKMVVTP